MKARYIRVSTLNQNIERQLAKQHPDEILYIDKISGAVPFHQRPQGINMIEDISTAKISYLSISSIDRLGRNTLDVLQTIEILHKNLICLKVDNLGLESMTSGKENPTFKLIVSVLANISEMERDTMLERQKEGIAIAKAKGLYKGRERNTVETPDKFLDKYPNVIAYLKKKNTHSLKDIAKLSDCSINTVLKVKRYLTDSAAEKY
ncbi:recombinase family protein [Flavobacterium sharifuzzamanii]|uniref:recombinase family protein n=1 Tax=Flavobacterium sharifuzzamanii TaxID=2211133 RepID=UPI000DAB6052|nr:recombinase family protein [Flavobacterium sharifuzzamanii]KAF2082008.1 recombinase family protein [Flavobacterium sharifuzzamanii]